MTESERILLKKMDGISTELKGIRDDISENNTGFLTYVAGQAACRAKCERNDKALFGNGQVGMKTKLNVLWFTIFGTGTTGGLLGAVWWLLSSHGH